MGEQILIDPEVTPTENVLRAEFGSWYPVFEEFIQTIESERFMFSPEWRYYKDGKAWLCKISYKKKTVVWLSAWSGFFQLGYYFTERTGAGIKDLKIGDELKKDYASNKPIGKLKPLVACINEKSQLDDIYTLLKYKVETK
jgi:hypothetical protein